MRALLQRILMKDKRITREYLEEESDVLFQIIPELKDEDGFAQRNPWHIYDVWCHTEIALSHSNHDFETRLALLLHDIGKPHCLQEDENGTCHFAGHAQESARMVVPILERLGFIESEIDSIVWLVANHSTPIDVSKVNKWNLAKYKKLLHMQACDCMAYNPMYVAKGLAKLEPVAAKLKEFEKSDNKREDR